MEQKNDGEVSSEYRSIAFLFRGEGIGSDRNFRVDTF